MRVISFDLWGTLIKANPDFLDAKIRLVSSYFDVTPTEAKKAFDETKQQIDALMELGGVQITQMQMFSLLAARLYKDVFNDNILLLKFINEYQALAVKHSPKIYSDETREYLHKFKENFHLVISSNTLLTSGTTLNACLSKLCIKDFFSNFKFSSEVGYAKPDRRMFLHTACYHIGDNSLTDFRGAALAGVKPIIINSNKTTIKDAYNFIIQN